MEFNNLQQAKVFETLTESKLKNAQNQSDAKKASQQFEAMFVKIMFKAMTDTVENDSLFGSGAGSDYYNDLFIDSMAEQVSKTSQVGLGKMIYRQITQEKQKNIEIRDLNSQDYIKSNIDKMEEKIAEVRAARAAKKAEAKEKANQIGAVLSQRLQKYESIIKKASEEFKVEIGLIKAVISQESYGNPKAVSRVGAKGLMQLMDGTAEGLGVKDSFNPEENIMAGTKYLKIMLNRFKDQKLALAAYNAGAGNVLKYKGIPPFKETQNYVSKVMQYYQNFQ